MTFPLRAGATFLLFGSVAGCLGALSGCEDDVVDPRIEGGAGLRFLFPAAADSVTGVRVELWNVNYVLPPDCLRSPTPARSVAFVADGPLPDSCTRMAVEIRNLIGERVRYVADTAFTGSLSWPWDKLDDRGLEVPSGYYPMRARCLDSRGSFTFRGHYYVLQDRERGSCEWPLWIRETGALPPSGELAYGPFPTESQTVLFDPYGVPLALVNFFNPFLVRVHAPGMETFEVEIVLRDGSYTDVTVTWTPAAAMGVESP